MKHAFSQWLDHPPDLPGLCEAFPEQFPYLLESSTRSTLGSHSLLLFAADEALVLDGDTGLTGPGTGSTFFERFESWYRKERSSFSETDKVGNAPIPFIGGWFVYLGYEMATEVEPTLSLPPNRTGLPDAIAHRCHGAIIIFHHPRTAARDRSVAVAESDTVLAEILSYLARGQVQPGTAEAGELSHLDEEDPEHYKASVAQIHEYLLAGDIFQVNISRAWTGAFETDADPMALYRSLRHFNPAPFAGLLRWRDCMMLSSSPERLVQMRIGCISLILKSVYPSPGRQQR